MKNKENIDKILNAYFQQERRKEKSQSLQEQVAQQTIKSGSFKWKALAIPIAATVLLSLGLSIWSMLLTSKDKVKIVESEIIYENDDFIIYIKE